MYGLCWWDDYVPVKIIDKYKSRMAGYKTLVDGFKNIDDHLMAIDVEKKELLGQVPSVNTLMYEYYLKRYFFDFLHERS